MTDIYRKPTSGEPFVPSARRQRMLLDAAERIRRGTSPRTSGPRQHKVVLVFNNTGTDFTAARPICRVDFSATASPMITPTMRASVVHDIPFVLAKDPSATSQDTWCVLTGPLKNGAARLGVVGGWAWVQLQVDDNSVDDWARPITSDRTKLLAVDGASPVERPGIAQVLWREGGTGTQDALVRLPCGVRALETIWKIDIDTGEIGSSADRGATSTGLGFYNVGDETFLYEYGPGGSDFLVKRSGDDRGSIGVEQFTTVWSVSPAGITSPGAAAVFSVGDEYVWVLDGSDDLHRIDDADGSDDADGTVSNGPHYIWDGPGGNMFVSGRGSADYPSGATLAVVDDTVSASTTVSGLWPGKCRLSSGWFVVEKKVGSSLPDVMWEYNNSLSSVASANAPTAANANRLYPAQRESSDDKVFCVELNSGGSASLKWHLIDVSGLSADWTITPHDTNDNEVIGLTADGDVYVLSLGGAIYRLDGSDGSVVWSTSVGSTGSGLGAWSYWLIREDDYLFVVQAAGAGKQLTYSSTAITAMALDYTDGSVEWARGNEDGRFIGRPYVDEGYLYVCGSRVKRATEPDVVP